MPVIEFAKQREYGVIINTYGSGGMGLSDNIEETYRLGADGWIFFTERALENKGEVLQQPYPVVLGGDYLSYGKCDQVTMPNTEAVRFAVGRLLDTGVRTIAVIGASPDMHVVGRTFAISATARSRCVSRGMCRLMKSAV